MIALSPSLFAIWPSLHCVVIFTCRFHHCCTLKRAGFLAMASASRETKQKQEFHLSCSGNADSPYTSNHQGLLYVYQNGYSHLKGHCRCSHAGSFACVCDGHRSSATQENGEILCDKIECFSSCHSGAIDDVFSRTESLSDGIGSPLTTDDVLDGYRKHISNGVPDANSRPLATNDVPDSYGRHVSNGVPDGVHSLHITDGYGVLSHDQGGTSIFDDTVCMSSMDGPSTESIIDLIEGNGGSIHPVSVDDVEKEMQNCNGDLQDSHGSSLNPSSAGDVMHGDSEETRVVTPEVETRKPAKRAFCKRCEKAQDLCICSRFKGVVQNMTKITILQNPKEKHHAVGSARVALLGLENVALIDVPEIYSKETFRIRPKVPGSKRSLAGRGGKKLQLKGGNYPTVLAHETVPSEAEIVQIRNLLIEIFNCQSNHLHASGRSQCALHLKHNGGMIHRGVSQESSHDSMHSEGGTGIKDGIMHKSRPPQENMDLFRMVHRGISKDNSHDSMLSEGGTGLKDGIMHKSRAPEESRGLCSEEGVPSGEHFVEDNSVVDMWALSLEELESLIPPGVALLYPSDKAIELSEPLHNMERHIEQEVKTPCHLIVLDGTWSKARRIYFENPWLQSLRHYKLSLSSPSLYEGVRKQPKPGCLSTLESIVYALKFLEPDTEGLDGLLEVFDSMVEDQRRCKQMKCSVQEFGIQ